MRVTAVCGDFYHAAAPYAGALSTALEGSGTAVRIVCYPSAFDVLWLDKCDVFVLCKEGVVPGSKDIGNRWISREDEEAIERFVWAGGMLVGWHSGLASYDPEGPIHAMYGGHFHGHPPQHEFELRPTGVEDPALPPDAAPCRMTDELYRMTVTADKAAIWLEGVSEIGGAQPVGWTRPHGKGKAVGFSLAHEGMNLTHPLTQGILRSAVHRAQT